MNFEKNQTPFAEFLNYINNNRRVKLKPDILRDAFSKLCQNFSIPCEDIYEIHNGFIKSPEHNIPIRSYYPATRNTKQPVIIYLHGGGHMVGCINDYDTTLRALANRSQAIIIAIEYRLAPEYPYPTGLNDCLYAINQLHLQFQEHAIYLAGDSAGGNLTASATLALHPNINLAGQILIYPGLDFTLSSPSHKLYKEHYFLENKTIEFYFDHYFSHAPAAERTKASPLLNPIPQQLSKTLIITADLDPLRDEGIYYHQKLQEQGINSELYNMPKMIHAFMSLYNVVPKQVETLFSVINTFINTKK